MSRLVGCCGGRGEVVWEVAVKARARPKREEQKRDLARIETLTTSLDPNKIADEKLVSLARGRGLIQQ